MVMERLRNFALRKRRAKATPSPLGSSSADHTLVKDTADLGPSLSLPSSIQSSSEADQDVVGATSQPRNKSTQTDVKPSQANKFTQTEPSTLACPQSRQTMNNKNEGPKKLAAKPSKMRASANKDWARFDSDLLAMAENLIADSNAILSSGLAVSQRLNDTARDILEAKTLISQIAGETTKLTKQMEMMQLRFSSAWVEFDNARTIHSSVFDYEAVEAHQEDALGEMMNSLQQTEKMIENEGGQVYEWPVDRVHKILSKINQVHTTNKSLYKYVLIEEFICSIMAQFRMVDFDQCYHHLLIVGFEPSDCVQQTHEDPSNFAMS